MPPISLGSDGQRQPAERASGRVEWPGQVLLMEGCRDSRMGSPLVAHREPGSILGTCPTYEANRPEMSAPEAIVCATLPAQCSGPDRISPAP